MRILGPVGEQPRPYPHLINIGGWLSLREHLGLNEISAVK